VIGSLEIAHAQVLAARASRAGVDAPEAQGETEGSAEGDTPREEEQS